MDASAWGRGALRAGVLLAGFAMLATLLAAAPANSRRDVRVQVGLLTPRGLNAADTTKATAALSDLAVAIDSASTGYRNSFSACVVSNTPTLAQACDLASLSLLDVFVTTVFGKAQSGSTDVPVTMTAGSLVDQHQVGQLTFSVADTTDAAKLSASFSGLTDANLLLLLGTPSLSNGAMTLSSYSPFLQLVPETATDRKYVGVLAHYLASQRIQTVPSQFTGIDTSAAGGSGSAGGICQNSPRYLHYTVDVQQANRLLHGTTDVYARATGQIIDCANPAVPLSFNGTDKFSLRQTKGTFASLIGILTLAFVSKTNSWANTGAVAGSVASFVDTDPTSTTVEQRLYDTSLHRLVNDLCIAISKLPKPTPAPNPTPVATATPVPTATPSAAATPVPHHGRGVAAPPTGRGGAPSAGAGTPSGSTSQTTGGTTTTPLGLGTLLVPAQPPLVCATTPPSAYTGT